MKPIPAYQKVIFLEERHELLRKWLHEQAELNRKAKRRVPHPFDFSFDPDPNSDAYHTARSSAMEFNQRCEDTACVYEYVLEAIANGDKELEKKLNPTNEYEI